MSEQPNLDQLMRDGMLAARDGNVTRARTIFQQIVKRDPDNEKAWYWLASVMETDDERVYALGKVLQLNPGNQRARDILRSLQARNDDDADGDSLAAPRRELLPGVERRYLILGAAGLAGLLVLIVVLLIVIIGNNNRAAQEQAALEGAMQATREQVALEQTATLDALATEAAILAATGEFTGPDVAGRPTLPPTWTPASQDAAVGVGGEATPAPTALGSSLFSGRLLGVSGNDLLGLGFVPVVEIPLDGSPPRTLYDGRGGAPDMAPQGDRLVYTIYSAGTREQGLQIAWMDGSRQPQLLSQLLGTRILQKGHYASFSPDGSRLAFTAREPGSTNNDIYIVSLTQLATQAGDGVASEAIQRMTDGTVNSTMPTWGDSTRLVYVHDARINGGPVELSLLDMTTGRSDFLTSDGNTLIESSPDISPNGQQIAFAAHSPASPEDSDIYIMSLIGGQPLMVVDTPGLALNPRWSPDGRFIAYGSDQDGDFEIFIVEVDTYAIYQVTVNNVYDMVNEWLP